MVRITQMNQALPVVFADFAALSMFCTISIIIYLHYNPHDIILHAFARPSLQYYLLSKMVEFPCAKVLDPYGGQQLDPVDPVDPGDPGDPGAGVVASVWASAKLG